ncbi:unnamed protein product [Toxocara canis]|uniref:Secreted protein n=1 Tax=Toxocara canis TaxID=6265 RepID=A0A183URY8_TOXCA|nr:unnamed protein product [Toxocara canis]
MNGFMHDGAVVFFCVHECAERAASFLFSGWWARVTRNAKHKCVKQPCGVFTDSLLAVSVLLCVFDAAAHRVAFPSSETHRSRFFAEVGATRNTIQFLRLTDKGRALCAETTNISNCTLSGV